MTTLRVATYNMRDLLDDVPALARVLASLRADVVCVQEVPRTVLGDRQARALAARAGLWAPMTHTGSGGTTVFVGPRVAVRKVRHLRLPVRAGARRRGYTVLDACVREGRMPFRAASIHLGLDPAGRERHAATIAGFLAGSGRVVIGGDANEALDGPAVRRLGAGIVPLGSTPATFPARAPRHAIDVLLGSGWAGDREVEVGAAAYDLVRASDHRPRLVELTL